MSVNSSISNSKALLYLAWLLFTALLWVAVLYGIVRYNKHQDLFVPYESLYIYQMEKLKNTKSVDTVFVGDSSLGNAVNAKLWQKLSGKKTLNLALTASYGYEGAYNMLSHTLFYSLKPRNLILMFNLEQPATKVSYLAFVQSSPIFWNKDIPVFEVIKLYWITLMNPQVAWYNLVNLIERKHLGNTTKNEIKNDYMMQSNADMKVNRFEKDVFPYKTADINLHKFQFLKKIGQVCKSENINCIYAHGPMVNIRCEGIEGYKKQVNEMIAAEGLDVVNKSPLCIPWKETGDSAYHVYTGAKDKYTKKYYQLIARYLN